MKNVLILSAGRRVSLLQGFQDAMKPFGGQIFAADMAPQKSAACQVADTSFRLPHCLADEYIETLEKLCQDFQIKVVIPTIDTELLVLSANRDRFEAFGCFILVGKEPLIETCRDKRKTTAFFEDRKLQAPRLYDIENIEFPVLVKPYDGSLSQGVFLIKEANELSDALRSNPKNMFCQYIDHAEHVEFTNDLYFDRHGDLKCVLPRKRLEVRGGEVSKALADKNEIVDEIFAKLSHVKGLRGCVNVQLFRHEKTHEKWYIEMNPRFGGGYPLTRHAGADFQSWILREYIGGDKIKTYHDWREDTVMLRYDAEVIVKP